MHRLEEIISDSIPLSLQEAIDSDYLMTVYKTMSRIGEMNFKAILKMDSVIALPKEDRLEAFKKIISEFEERSTQSDTSSVQEDNEEEVFI